ncbi:outer membrane biogenesis lipoprotein LolB [Sphingobium francense]|nr:outer membrane biogenesis lipoprotein LolB [Sphingobium indicum]
MANRHKPSRRDARCPGAVEQEHRSPVLAWNDQRQKERVDVKSRIVQRSQRIALRPDGAQCRWQAGRNYAAAQVERDE